MTLGNHIVHDGLVTCPVTDWLLSANKVSLNLDVTTNILFSSGPKEEQDKGEQDKESSITMNVLEWYLILCLWNINTQV